MAPVDARKKLDQMRRNKTKNVKKNINTQPRSSSGGNVKDLRQLIASKKRAGSGRSPNRVQNGRITKTSFDTTNGSGPRDLRDSNRKLAARKSVISQSTPRGAAIRNGTQQLRRSERTGIGSRAATSMSDRGKIMTGNLESRSYRPGKKPQQQYYIPPHLQAQHPATYIIAPTAAPAPVPSKLAMDSVPEVHQTGASVLVSNLMPSITHSEIIELFGDVGVMTAVNMINQTTALVTYQNGRDAVEAVKVYHNRLLDGKPMFVYMMPNAATTSSVRSRIQ